MKEYDAPHESLIFYSFDLKIYIQSTSSRKCWVDIQVCYASKNK